MNAATTGGGANGVVVSLPSDVVALVFNYLAHSYDEYWGDTFNNAAQVLFRI